MVLPLWSLRKLPDDEAVLLQVSDGFYGSLGGAGGSGIRHMGAYRFRTLEPDCYYTPDGQRHPLVFSGTSFRSGLSFGLAGEQNLLYHLPEKLFGSFSGKLLLTGEKNASAHCRIINNGTPVQEFRLDGNTTPKTLTISTPSGEFGFQLASTTPTGVVVLGDAQFCAGRFDSGAISNGTDGRISGGASRKSQKNEAAS